jgi:methylmalonyl-CoA/ethylmalonyl-CoA epimerase
MNPSIQQIDHIAIAVQSIKETLPVYEKALGITCERVEEVPSQKVLTAFLNVGGVHLELLEPTSEDSTIAKFLADRGEGLHHIAFRIDDIAGGLARAKENGVRLIHEQPFPGAGGKQVAFLHPKSTHGVLTELCQDSNPHH